jgi:hypothetical protein
MHEGVRSALLVSTFLALACERREPPAPAVSPSVSPLPPPPIVAPPSVPEDRGPVVVSAMRPVPEEAIPSAVRDRVAGAVEHAVGWLDRHGENLAIFSRQETTHQGRQGAVATAQLTIQHFLVTSEGRATRMRIVKERIDRCDAELLLSYRDAALAVTDLDEDGVGELTFAYTRACRKDATPPILKLVMLEDGVKYILRGTVRDEQGRGGEYRVDPSFKGAPEFLEHAKEIWAKVS